MPPTSVPAAEAAKLFRTQTVQVGTRVKVKNPAGGRDLETFRAETVPLKAEHILAAVKADDGTVSITTVDGRKYSAAGNGKSAD